MAWYHFRKKKKKSPPREVEMFRRPDGKLENVDISDWESSSSSEEDAESLRDYVAGRLADQVDESVTVEKRKPKKRVWNWKKILAYTAVSIVALAAGAAVAVVVGTLAGLPTAGVGAGVGLAAGMATTGAVFGGLSAALHKKYGWPTNFKKTVETGDSFEEKQLKGVTPDQKTYPEREAEFGINEVGSANAHRKRILPEAPTITPSTADEIYRQPGRKLPQRPQTRLTLPVDEMKAPDIGDGHQLRGFTAEMRQAQRENPQATREGRKLPELPVNVMAARAAARTGTERRVAFDSLSDAQVLSPMVNKIRALFERENFLVRIADAETESPVHGMADARFHEEEGLMTLPFVFNKMIEIKEPSYEIHNNAYAIQVRPPEGMEYDTFVAKVRSVLKDAFEANRDSLRGTHVEFEDSLLHNTAVYGKTKAAQKSVRQEHWRMMNAQEVYNASEYTEGPELKRARHRSTRKPSKLADEQYLRNFMGEREYNAQMDVSLDQRNRPRLT